MTAGRRYEAMQLRIAEQYVSEFGQLAKAGNTFVVPANLADLTSMMALATDIAKGKNRPRSLRIVFLCAGQKPRSAALRAWR